MSYSWDKIGKRIQEERKKMPSRLPKTGKRKAGYVTQAELAELICQEMQIDDTGTYRKKVNAWEHGKPADLDELLALCKIFHCDINYLLCKMDTRHYADMADVEKYGLTEDALSTLREMCDNGHGFELATISAMIQDRQLIESITDLWLSAREVLFHHPLENLVSFQSHERKQKEFELYRNLVDFIEDDSDEGILQNVIKTFEDNEWPLID